MNSRRLRHISPVQRARNALLRMLKTRPFSWLSPTTQFYIGFAALVLITALLLANTYSRSTLEAYKEGDVVHRTVSSPADIASVDELETEKRYAAAGRAVRSIFRFDPTRIETSVQTLRAAWENATGQINSPQDKHASALFGELNTALAHVIKGSKGFDADDLERFIRLLREANSGYIFDDSDTERFKGEITLADARTNMSSIIAAPQERATPLSIARANLRTRISRIKDWSETQKAQLISIALPLIQPTITFDEAATTHARQAAVAEIAPTIISLKRNQVIAREGDTVNERTLAQFAAVRAYSNTGRPLNHFIGLLLILTAIYWMAWKFTEHRSETVSLALSKKRAFALIGSAIIIQTTLIRIGLYFADAVATQSTRAPLNDPTLWGFAIPFAAASLLIVMLVDTQLALITGLITALFAGLIAPSGIALSFYAVISSATAIYGIGRYRERQSVTVAGLLVGVVNAFVAVALLAYAQQALTLNTVLLALACGFLGGLLTIIFTAGGLPINESFFGILTDVKLLELSNADLPVLSQLALRAPGTNQHSHAVGQLAEDACRAVGANPLLARIGALYHDIGKLGAPDYFVENQQGYNPHDRLKPSQSARIITSHVTYGLKLAKQIGVPQKIADFIPQHPGTRTLHFFLRKAQALASVNEEINEAEFRYPGPKPQFKETAIMMLADSCEAAARSLARPDPENIRAIVTKIIDAIVSDGQLDECDLTLRELMTIRETLIAALTAIYHARIDYPGFNPPSLMNSLPPTPAAELDTEERGMSYSRASDVPINKGGEVEDEAVSHKTRN